MTATGERECLGRPGFSLLETVLVVIIIGALAALAAPRYANSISRYRAVAAAQRVAADLAFARDRAMTGGAQRVVVFAPAAGQYEILDMAGLDNPSADYVVKLHAGPYHAELVSADFGGDATVRFDAYGLPDDGGQVVVQAGHFQKTIVLNAASGKASVQ